MNLKELSTSNLIKFKDIPINLSKEMLNSAESGFKEFNTAKKVLAVFKDLGLKNIKNNIALTGIVGTLDTGIDGPNIAILGELDALPVPGHPFENKENGMAHACGHHIQIGNIVSVIIALKDPKILEKLTGKITFIAVPAEEFVEIEWRNELRKKNSVEFLSGKQEMLKLGVFDNIDIAMMTHATPRNIKFSYGGTNNGLVAKFIEFKGKASHAGANPEKGINALNAANIALNAINSQRETFKDEDHIRVHPIITKGGNVVSTIPDQVTIETFVRGGSIKAILDANTKVDNCFKAGALATGATVKITTLPGYLPIENNTDLQQIYLSNLKDNYSNQDIEIDNHSGGSTDMGDLSNIIPSIHPYVGGSSGTSNHSRDMVVNDYNLAVIESGKMMAHTVIDLLENNGKRAKKVISNHTPRLDKKEYLELLRGLSSEETYIPKN
jgi:amidohydrolase